MEDELRRTIYLVRLALEADPAGTITGKLPQGSAVVQVPEGRFDEYREFLGECDGARCGAIDFWPSSQLTRQQFRVSYIPGGADRWFSVGQILDDPLVIGKSDGMLWLFRSDPPPEEGIVLGSFLRFLKESVFGPGYADLIPNPATDRWYQLLRRLELVA